MKSPRATALLALLVVPLLAGCLPESLAPSTSRPSTAPAATVAATPAATTVTSPAPTRSGPLDLTSIAITLEPFAEISGGPLAITAPDDDTGRLFVAAQDGKIWAVEADGTVLEPAMVDLGARLRSGGEQGLLGLALHPLFPIDSRVFVNYTNADGDTIVASLEIDPNDPNRILDDSHRQLLLIDQPYANHNGGEVLFGPDGFLYVFMGDGGAGGDPHNNGQSRNTLLGKILRLNVDEREGGEDYSVPPDNPFVGTAGEDEIWHTGLRNPWRASFDRATGDLWIGDVGQGSWEEIDVARAGAGGLNFGWNVMEGDHCFPPGTECRGDGLTPPVSEYGHELGCTVIGGYVYRGQAYPALVGAYLFSDYCSGRVFAIDAATNSLVEPLEVGAADGRVSAFGEDVAGELYVTTLDGPIYRVVAATR